MKNNQLVDENDKTFSVKKTNFLPAIAGLFVGTLILSNILASKMVQIGVLVFDGGTLLFPFSYILGDVLAEVYGHKTSKKIIFTGFFMLLFASINIYIVSHLPAESEWQLQKSFDDILLQMPRITAGSLAGYLIGTISNSYVLSEIKKITKERYLWVRTIGSTLVGELLDSAVFVIIAFTGVYSASILITMIFSNYIFKTTIEVLFTPITYKVIAFVKQKEEYGLI